MADDLDVQAVRAGNKDLAQRDLDQADLTGADLNHSDLTKAHLQRAILNEANLKGSTLTQSNSSHMQLQNSNLQEIIWESSSIYGVYFQNSDLRNAKLKNSHFSKCNFTGADLRGADFRWAHINEGSTFDKCLVDETTRFDGARVFRPTTRQEAFRYYEVERGVLIRKPSSESASSLEHTEIRKELASKTDQLVAALESVAPQVDDPQALPGIGHNNPPSSVPLTRPDYDALLQAINDAKIEIPKEKPAEGRIKIAYDAISRTAPKIMAWLGRRLEMAADEAAKEFGKTIGKSTVLLGVGVAIVTALSEYAAAIKTFAKAIIGVVLGSP